MKIVAGCMEQRARFFAACGVAGSGGSKGYSPAGAMRVIRTLSIVMIAGCAVAAERPAARLHATLTATFRSALSLTRAPDARVKFLTRASAYTLFVKADEAVFAGRDGSVERVKFRGANRKARVEALDKQPGTRTISSAKISAKWRTNLATYGKVALRGVYRGIDLVFYRSEGQVEYDWVVAPGADLIRSA